VYRFSERLAVVAGIVLPIGETLGRWGSLWVQPWAYLDDIFIGAFFLIAAWMSRRRPGIGERCLSAAYGFACAIGCGSLAMAVTQLEQTDPSGLSNSTAAIVKAIMLALGTIGLVGTVRGREVTPEG